MINIYSKISNKKNLEDNFESYNIITKIINKKASKLAHYYLIMNKTLLFLDNFGKLICDYYILTLNKLDKLDKLRYNKSYSTLGYLMGSFNQQFNMNIDNYGTEGDILYIINNDFTINNIMEEYVKNYKKVNFEEKLSSNEYSLEDYIKQIGSNIAIILFLFCKDIPDKLDINYLNENFKNAYYDEYEKLKTDTIKIEIKKAYDNALKLIPNFKNLLIINSEYKEPQQRAYNLYKYPVKEYNENKTVWFFNSVILRFKEDKLYLLN